MIMAQSQNWDHRANGSELEIDYRATAHSSGITSKQEAEGDETDLEMPTGVKVHDHAVPPQPNIGSHAALVRLIVHGNTRVDDNTCSAHSEPNSREHCCLQQ